MQLRIENDSLNNDSRDQYDISGSSLSFPERFLSYDVAHDLYFADIRLGGEHAATTLLQAASWKKQD
jgi:hypothetical protein